MEDDDTDVDESTVQTTSSDGEKMDTGETKTREELETAVVTGDKENGVKQSKDSEAVNADTKTTEDVVEKAADGEKAKGSEDKEKEEGKKDVVVIEDEEEEPEPEDEVTDDRDDGGEDPSEVEIEKFNMPLEQALLSGE